MPFDATPRSLRNGQESVWNYRGSETGAFKRRRSAEGDEPRPEEREDGARRVGLTYFLNQDSAL